MSAAPTPGPWVYHSRGVYASAPLDANGWATDRLLVADRWSGAVRSPEECDANARLAALAPELRDALELALFHAHRKHRSTLLTCRAEVCKVARKVLGIEATAAGWTEREAAARAAGEGK